VFVNRRRKIVKQRICVKCNRVCEAEDIQCPRPECNLAQTAPFNTKFERQKYAQRFPREAERNHSLPLNPNDPMKMPGEYKVPHAWPISGGQFESKRSKH
jgi:hypothetical protein